jgi:predicted metal-dependent enzyme (double-stranded beta helix superfamily)
VEPELGHAHDPAHPGRRHPHDDLERSRPGDFVDDRSGADAGTDAPDGPLTEPGGSGDPSGPNVSVMDPRTVAIAETMDDIRAIEAEHGATREGVERIRDRLLQLVARRDLFSLAVYPPPGEDEEVNSCLYRIAQDADDRYALYANASRGGVSTPPHNHTTWAVVVGCEGQELNRFYRRTDDGVEETHQHMVEAGTGVAMVGDDLHSIHIEGPALNFHCYGLALERLEGRVFYDAKKDEWRHFNATGSIREARAGLVNC